MDEQSIVVDEIRHVGIYRRKQRVAIGRLCGLRDQPDRLLIRTTGRGTRDDSDGYEADQQQNQRLPDHTASPSLTRAPPRHLRDRYPPATDASQRAY